MSRPRDARPDAVACAQYHYLSNHLGGVRVEYMGSQIDGLSVRNDQWFVGTKGKAYMDFAQASFYDHDGNKTRTAQTLGITREGLYKKMKRLGVE